jgi:hypothetical protein
LRKVAVTTATWQHCLCKECCRRHSYELVKEWEELGEGGGRTCRLNKRRCMAYTAVEVLFIRTIYSISLDEMVYNGKAVLRCRSRIILVELELEP